MDVVAEETQKPAQGRQEDKKKGSFWKELPVLVVVALVLALIIKTFVIQAFYIPSESMENTLLVNDRVLVNKLVYHIRDIERGDVVVFSGVDSWDGEVQFEEPSNPVAGFFRWVGTAFGVVPGEKDYIKRVIGVAGDTVKCCDARAARHGQRRAARREELPLPGRQAVHRGVRDQGAAGPPVGDGRPSLGLPRLPLPPG